jgi:hypothetical protein
MRALVLDSLNKDQVEACGRGCHVSSRLVCSIRENVNLEYVDGIQCICEPVPLRHLSATPFPGHYMSITRIQY